MNQHDTRIPRQRLIDGHSHRYLVNSGTGAGIIGILTALDCNVLTRHNKASSSFSRASFPGVEGPGSLTFFVSKPFVEGLISKGLTLLVPGTSLARFWMKAAAAASVSSPPAMVPCHSGKTPLARVGDEASRVKTRRADCQRRRSYEHGDRNLPREQSLPDGLPYSRRERAFNSAETTWGVCKVEVQSGSLGERGVRVGDKGAVSGGTTGRDGQAAREASEDRKQIERDRNDRCRKGGRREMRRK